MEILVATNVFEALRGWLRKTGHPLPRDARIQHAIRADAENRRRARQFCFVEDGRPIVYVAAAIEALPVTVVTGLLLHECAHVLRGAGEFDAEIEADTWIKSTYPRAGYRYRSACKYLNPWTSRPRVAKNVECVSMDFVRLIFEGA